MCFSGSREGVCSPPLDYSFSRREQDVKEMVGYNPNESVKDKMFIRDLDKMINPLLSVSGHLARVENVLSGLGEDARSRKGALNKTRKVLARAAPGCRGAPGEPEPKGTRGIGRPDQLSFREATPGLRAFGDNEPNTPH